MNKMTCQNARKLVSRPVSCIDCHEPETMSLRVTRPAFLEGIRKVKALQGTADSDVTRGFLLDFVEAKKSMSVPRLSGNHAHPFLVDR